MHTGVACASREQRQLELRPQPGGVPLKRPSGCTLTVDPDSTTPVPYSPSVPYASFEPSAGPWESSQGTPTEHAAARTRPTPLHPCPAPAPAAATPPPAIPRVAPQRRWEQVWHGRSAAARPAAPAAVGLPPWTRAAAARWPVPHPRVLAAAARASAAAAPAAARLGRPDLPSQKTQAWISRCAAACCRPERCHNVDWHHSRTAAHRCGPLPPQKGPRTAPRPASQDAAAVCHAQSTG
eukprot:scaffold4232_cov107-Isochrysis_galbana.AAC.5